MWENSRFIKMSGRSVNMEFLYDIDMLEMIRWPSMEDTSNVFEAMASSCQGLGPYDSSFPFQHIVPYHGSSSFRSAVTDDSAKRDCNSSRIDCDDTLMVTSNDALRFEEDCLFESPSPSCRNIPHHQSQQTSGAESSANRFLCQKSSMADMTLAQLNDSNASDTSHRVDLAELKIEVHDLDHIFDALSENFSKPANSSATHEPVISRLLTSKQSNTQQPLCVVKEENEEHVVVKREIKTENISPIVKCSSSLKTPKTLKRCRTSSVALSEGDGKDEPNSGDGLRKTDLPGHETASASPSCFLPVGKKIKLEITDSSCDIISRVASNDNLPSKSAISDEENADSDDLSDTESVVSKGSSVQDLMRSNGSDKRYFWQYNIQAKGPKEKRLCKNIGATDPHVLKDFEDPVFDPGHSNVHFVHSGKARKGDGTDITPNPQKLLQIGSELKTLNSTIEEMMQASDFVTRTTTMKEKNKYASRVCRLKKKAQHEANKIKLQGLNEEHNQLMSVLNSIRSKLRQQNKTTPSSSSSSSVSSSSSSFHSSSSSSANKRQQGVKVNFTEELDNLTTSCLKVNVAGRADDYVSSVLLASSTTDERDDVWLYSD